MGYTNEALGPFPRRSVTPVTPVTPGTGTGGGSPHDGTHATLLVAALRATFDAVEEFIPDPSTAGVETPEEGDGWSVSIERSTDGKRPSVADDPPGACQTCRGISWRRGARPGSRRAGS